MSAANLLAPSDLEALAALEAKATEGPWAYDGRAGSITGAVIDPVYSGCVAHEVHREDDGAFIVAARNAQPALVATVREAWRERDEARNRERFQMGLKDMHKRLAEDTWEAVRDALPTAPADMDAVEEAIRALVCDQGALAAACERKDQFIQRMMEWCPPEITSTAREELGKR